MIRIRGREYSVSKGERTTIQGATEVTYTLTGKRGAVYMTMRNVHRPSRMFVNSLSISSRVMEGVWLDDAGGSLTVVVD